MACGHKLVLWPKWFFLNRIFKRPKLEKKKSSPVVEEPQKEEVWLSFPSPDHLTGLSAPQLGSISAISIFRRPPVSHPPGPIPGRQKMTDLNYSTFITMSVKQMEKQSGNRWNAARRQKHSRPTPKDAFVVLMLVDSHEVAAAANASFCHISYSHRLGIAFVFLFFFFPFLET